MPNDYKYEYFFTSKLNMWSVGFYFSHTMFTIAIFKILITAYVKVSTITGDVYEY